MSWSGVKHQRIEVGLEANAATAVGFKQRAVLNGPGELPSQVGVVKPELLFR